jgi:hypothetical protein
MASGNSFSGLMLYLRMSAAIAGGFSGAMSYELGRRAEWYYAAIVLAGALISMVLGFRNSERSSQVCAWLVVCGFTVAALKEGFVRHDDLHDVRFFGLMMVACAAVPWPKHDVRPPGWLGRSTPALLAGTLCIAVLLGWKADGSVPANPTQIPNDVRSLASEMNTTLISSHRNAAIKSARTSLEAAYDLPSAIVRQLPGQTVAIEPWENTVAWAVGGVIWDPEPVLQQYSAYESSLDALDASFLRSSSAPTRILVQPTASYEQQFQDPFLGAPGATVVRLCRYAQAEATGTWQLLVRVPDRCGALVRIRLVEAAFGESVAVPTAPSGEATIATFSGVGSSLGYRLENALLKAPAIEMRTPSATYRFIAGTEGDLHILRPPSTLGYGAAYGPTTIGSFSLVERDVGSGEGDYWVTFYELRMR